MRKYTNDTIDEIMENLEELFQEVPHPVRPTGKKKLYFAGPWFTDKAKACYDYCTAVSRVLGKRCKYKIFWPRYMKKCKPIEAFEKDIEELDNADVVIAFISDKDVGTAFEIGYAKAKGKPVVLLVYDETCFESKTNLMLAYAGAAISIKNFDKFLLNELTHSDYINTQFHWEVLE